MKNKKWSFQNLQVASWTHSEGLWKGPVFPFTATVTWYWCMMFLFDFLPALLFMYIRQVTQVSDVPVVAAQMVYMNDNTSLIYQIKISTQSKSMCSSSVISWMVFLIMIHKTLT